MVAEVPDDTPFDAVEFAAKLRLVILRPMMLLRLLPEYLGWTIPEVMHCATRRPAPYQGSLFIEQGDYVRERGKVSAYQVIDAWTKSAATVLKESLHAEEIGRAATIIHADGQLTITRTAAVSPLHKSEWAFLNDICHRPLTHEELGRRRYAPVAGARYKRYGPRYGPGISLMAQVAPMAGRRLLDAFFARIDAELGLEDHYLTFETSLRRLLKDIGGWAKRNGDAFIGWEYLVGLLDLGGYVPAPPAEEFLPQVQHWVAEDIQEPGSNLPGWQELFCRGVGVFAEGAIAQAPPTSYREFVDSWKWTRDGSSDVSEKVRILIPGYDKPVPVRRTKDLTALTTAPDVLWRIANLPEPQLARAMVKREPGKARAVLVTDMTLYLQMAWLSEAIEPALRGAKATSLFFSGRKFTNLWRDMGMQSMDTTLWKLPIDQSEFDHHVSLRMIGIVLDKIDSLLVTSEQHGVLASIRRSIVEQPAGVVVGRHTIPVKKGILSGWRWTALLDTWIQFAEVYASWQWVHYNSGGPAYSPVGLYTQGDDARFITYIPGFAIALCETMRAAGFDINPGKSWFSYERDEFLRQFSDSTGVRGYLSRSLTSIMWRNPIKSEPVDKATELRAICQRWSLLRCRRPDIRAATHHCQVEVRRMALRAGLSYEQVRRWVRAPACYGGMGLAVLGDDPTDDTRDRDIFSLSSTVPLRRAVLPYMPGVESQAHWAAKFGLTWEDTRASVYTAAKGRLRPFMANALVDRRSVALKWSQEVRVPPLYPRGTVGSAAFPLAPKFKNPGCPGWVSQVFVDRLIRERRYDDVDAALIQPHATLSAWVRATHRVRTWIDWVTGRLSLSLKPYDTWGMAYLAGVVSDYERRYLKSCLISSQSFSGVRRKRLEVGFYMSQHHPAMYSTIKVGA